MNPLIDEILQVTEGRDGEWFHLSAMVQRVNGEVYFAKWALEAGSVPEPLKQIYLGQECICPDGLGRVVRYSTRKNEFDSIVVETYVRNRSCAWDARNVTLIDPITRKTWKPN